jgi:predicted RNase H-like HicB family nuclease
MKEYTVIYESGKRNWSAYVPDLPGCIATGKTRKQVEQVIREAIEFHVEG